MSFEPLAQNVLEKFAASKKSYVAGQLASGARQYSRGTAPQKHETEVMDLAYAEVDRRWETLEGRIALIPGKDALSEFNRQAQEMYGSSVTPTAVIAAMSLDQVPSEMRNLVESIRKFSTTNVE